MLRASAAVPLPLVGPTAQRDVRSCPPSTFWFELCCSWQEAHHSWTLSSSSTCWSSLLRVAALGAESPVRAPGLSLTLELLRAPCLQHRDVLGDCLPLHSKAGGNCPSPLLPNKHSGLFSSPESRSEDAQMSMCFAVGAPSSAAGVSAASRLPPPCTGMSVICNGKRESEASEEAGHSRLLETECAGRWFRALQPSD